MQEKPKFWIKNFNYPSEWHESAYIQGVHAGLQRWMEMQTETFLQVLQTSFISLAHEHYLDMLLFGH